MEEKSSPIDRDLALSLLERMLRMRRFEEAVIDLSTQGHPFGHFHVYIGQEATGAAVTEALADDDLVLTTHRNHGHLIGRGSDPGRMMAEILGRGDGLSGGRGGTIHLCDRSRGFLQTSGVVGGALSLSIGAGHHLKREGLDRVAVVFFGDGAMEEGVAYEALNIASLWSLPVLFVCENNSPGAIGQKGGGYPTSVHAVSQFTRVAEVLGMTSRLVPEAAGVEGIHRATVEALAAIRRGDEPVFLETVTTRWPGSQPLWPELATGVTNLDTAWGEAEPAGPHADWIRAHDPILLALRSWTERGIIDKDAALEIDARVAGTMRASQDFAIASPEPRAEDALARVFAPEEHAA